MTFPGQRFVGRAAVPRLSTDSESGTTRGQKTREVLRTIATHVLVLILGTLAGSHLPRLRAPAERFRDCNPSGSDEPGPRRKGLVAGGKWDCELPSAEPSGD